MKTRTHLNFNRTLALLGSALGIALFASCGDDP